MLDDVSEEFIKARVIENYYIAFAVITNALNNYEKLLVARIFLPVICKIKELFRIKTLLTIMRGTQIYCTV